MPRVQLSGGAYQTRSVIASAQRSLNLYAEPMPQGQGEPSAWAHYPTAGLRVLGALPEGRVRGIRQVTTGQVYAVAGSGVYRVDSSDWSSTLLGSITPGIITPVSMADNGLQMVIVDGSVTGWTVDLTNDTLAQITDPNFPGATTVDYLDTYFIFSKPGTPQFFWSGSLDTTFDSLDFANKESFSDLLVTLAVAKREIWLLGTRTTEIWFNSGFTFSTTDASPQSTFQQIQGTFVDHGCIAAYSAAVHDNSVFWLTQDRQGVGMVLQGAGYQTQRVSTFAIEQEIAGYTRVTDAIGFFYLIAGHVCYVLTFPSADHTWVYDVSTKQWHEWAWIDNNGREHRHRANCCFPVWGVPIIGDWQNGYLYALDREAFTDNGQPIKRERTFPHLINEADRVYYRQFVADIETGNAPAVPDLALPAPPSGGWHQLPLGEGFDQANAQGISADGHVAVGWVSPPGSGLFQAACYWTSASGSWTDAEGPFVITDADPDSGPYSDARAASADGSIIVGASLMPHGGGNYTQPFMWTATDGWMVFDTVPGWAQGISADGTRIIGYAMPLGLTDGQATACYWDVATLTRTDLPYIPGTDSGSATAVSADGTYIVGGFLSGLGEIGNTMRAFLWSAATGTIDLGLPGGVGATGAQALGVSNDGTLVAGDYFTSGTGGSWMWTEAGGMQVLPCRGLSYLHTVTGDGSTILGSDATTGTNVGYYQVASARLRVPAASTLWPSGTVTDGYGISDDATVIVGGTSSGTPTYLPFAYKVPRSPLPATTPVPFANLINLEWSDDRGHRYGSPVAQNIGPRGNYLTSLQWQRLGLARDRVFRLSWSVPVPTALQGAWIEVDTSAKT